MSFFVHPQGLCETEAIGNGTRIWAFAHVLAGASVGADCNICDGVFVENGAIIGNRVTVKCGVQLWDGVTLEDDVFVGPNVTFANDPFPRSRQKPVSYTKTLVCRGASIGANATILPGVIIGSSAMVGAGAVVTSSVPPNAIVYGNPARIMDYVGSHRGRLSQQVGLSPDQTSVGVPVGVGSVQGAALYELPLVKDLRGDLSVGEFERTVPFIPKRFFVVFGVPSEMVRGEHAHRACRQFLVCIKGRCSTVVDDGLTRAEVLLDRPNLGLLIEPGVWGIQYKYSDDAVLLVFASEFYDNKDYIRDYKEFLAFINRPEN